MTGAGSTVNTAGLGPYSTLKSSVSAPITTEPVETATEQVA